MCLGVSVHFLIAAQCLYRYILSVDRAVSSHDHVTFCYMFDMLLYCAIIVLSEGVFGNYVQLEGFKPTGKTMLKSYCFDSVVIR